MSKQAEKQSGLVGGGGGGGGGVRSLAAYAPIVDLKT